MNSKQLKKAVLAALEADHDAICAHIATGYAKEKTSTAGIEQFFETALKKHLPGNPTAKRATLLEVGTKQSEILRRKRGWIDIHIPDFATGMELKAVRLPRTYMTGLSGRRYDFGQIVSDYLRMVHAKKLRWSYVVVLLYGPMVEDSSSSFRLYETFHNSMYLDAYIARKFAPLPEQEGDERKGLYNLKWLEPYLNAQGFPERTFAVKYGKLGAVIIGCRWDDG